MSDATGFLGGARDRLLPARLPFGFFLSAAGFHVLAWLALFAAADQVAGFRGGTGLLLAALHLLTLGVFTTTAVGACYQLLPVVTRRPLTRLWPVRLSFWLLVPGIAALSAGMGFAAPGAMQAGAVLVTAGLALFAGLTADNLRKAGNMPVVAAHGWGALAALVGFGLLGLLLVWDVGRGVLDDRAGLAVLHMVLAAFGFMGLLVLGLSMILIPMFALSRSPAARPGWAQLVLAVLALAGFGAGVLTGTEMLLWLAFVAGTGAAAVYLGQMRRVMRVRMRKRLGLSFLMIRAGWGFLALCLLLGGLILAGAAIPNAPALFGLVLLAGWLLTFLTGVLQRIMPFLASMHVSGTSGLPPLLSELTAEGPLRLHAACHLAAVAAVAAGIVLDQVLLVRIGAGLGAVGALAFAWFGMRLALRLRG